MRDVRRETEGPGLLERVLDIALGAGEQILAVYRSDFAVSKKDDDSPLTQADLAAHRHILAALKALTPDLPVLSEEESALPWSARRSWQRYWLVDPLDGTREFVKRNGEFTVNIALVEAGRPVLGVVHAPALEQTFAAAQGAGAFRVRGAARERLATRRVPVPPVYVVSRSHQDESLQRLLAKAPRHDAVSRGSSLKFCLVAEGAADFYPRTGPTSEWDTAAGQCVVEQAGGAVWRLPQRTPLAYNEKESLLNPSFAVVGDPAHDWSAVMP
ncbi:MAG TPA: 3'(2'),5'-bisphosphate nucleotidase CysQ [Candidatus Binatia bacterium]|nr:3'(2'),5'-bisphosphate nucleotidase CysQ [Candidatus Binatia bacterium]